MGCPSPEVELEVAAGGEGVPPDPRLLWSEDAVGPTAESHPQQASPRTCQGTLRVWALLTAAAMAHPALSIQPPRRWPTGAE